MPPSGPAAGFLSWSTSSSCFVLLAIALILFCARWYIRACKSSAERSQQSRTISAEKDGAFVPWEQRGISPPLQIKSETPLSSENPPPLPPISDATEAVLSQQYTISFPSETGAPQATHNHETPRFQSRPESRQGHASSYYQSTADPYALEPRWNPIATCQTARYTGEVTPIDTDKDFSTSYTRQYSNDSSPPVPGTAYSPPEASFGGESATFGMHTEFIPAGQHCDYSLPPVRKQRESLQVFRGVGQEKGRTWKRKVLEYT